MTRNIVSGRGIGTNVNPEPPRDMATFYNPDLGEIRGQSNAAGLGFIVPVDIPVPMLDWIYNPTAGWVQMVPAVNTRGATGLSGSGAADGCCAAFGIEIRLMTLIHTLKGRNQYLIKYAVSNTPLADDAVRLDWSTTTNELLPRANIHSKNARQALGDLRPPRWIVWMQGENDAQTTAFRDAYETNLTNYIAAVRTFYAYQIPFIIVKLGDGQTWNGGAPALKAHQENVIASVSNCFGVSTDGLAALPDELHWGEDALDTIAQRTYDVMIANNLLN